MENGTNGTHVEPASPGSRSNLILGSRNSKLALVQAELVKAELQQAWPDLDVTVVSMKTAGDKNLFSPLYLLGGKSLWTKELEIALLDGRVDAVVHSLKDVPTVLPERCVLGAIPGREDPTDALVVRHNLPYKSLAEMPKGSVIGTSSVRRVAQLRKLYPGLEFADMRGNIATRLGKLDAPDSNYTALILATAGLARLHMDDRITARLQLPHHYAVGQGALGIEIREGDKQTATYVGRLNDWCTSFRAAAERALLRRCEGGCSVPISTVTSIRPLGVEEAGACPVAHKMANVATALDEVHPAYLTLTGAITSLAGTRSIERTMSRVVHSMVDAEALGESVASQLIAHGGRSILEELGKHVQEVKGESLPGGDDDEVPPHPHGMIVENGHVVLATSPTTGNGFDLHEAHAQAHASAHAHAHMTVFADQGDKCLRPRGW